MIIFVILCLVEFFIILKFKSLILKVILLVALIPQITLIAFSYGLPTPGVLMLQSNLFSNRTIVIANILCSLYNFILIAVFYPLRINTYSYKPLTCTKGSYAILLFIIFLSAILSYPRVSGLGFRIDMATIYIAANVTVLICKRNRYSTLNIIHLCILLFVIIGGDRVDSMASVILVMLFVKKQNLVKEQISNRTILIGGFVLFSLGVASGLMRDGNSITLDTFLYSIYAQQTVSDVVFVFLSSIEYYSINGPTLEVLGNLLFGLIPGPFYGVVSPYNYTIFLQNNFSPNPGGGLFYSEGMLALGFIGVILYAFIYGGLMRFLFTKRSYIYSSIFLTLFIMVFRIQWYGIEYCYKPVIFSLFFTSVLLGLKRGLCSNSTQ